LSFEPRVITKLHVIEQTIVCKY